MSLNLFEQLHAKGFIEDVSLGRIKTHLAGRKFSLNLELRILLYLGILAISTGIGILIYTHLDQLGHLAIIGAMSLIVIGCYVYCFKTSTAFSWQKVESPNPWFDYIILLGGLVLVTLIGYLQFHFSLFGQRWGLASFIPMVLLFLSAYYFDHQGLLSMAIANLAAWIGITVDKSIFSSSGLLANKNLIAAMALLGLFLLTLTVLLRSRPYKTHFHSTYQQFGTHFAFIASIAGIIAFEKGWPFWLLLLILLAYYHLKQAFRDKNSYFLIVSAIYVYIGISYIFSSKLFEGIGGDGELYANLFYYLFSGIGLAILLHRLHQKIQAA